MQFMKYQSDIKDMNLRAKGFFISRIAEVPFNMDSSEAFNLKTKGLDPGEVKDKKAMARAISLLQLHPCYIVKILKSEIISLEDKKEMLKQIYTSTKRSGIDRTNFLLLSIYE